MTDYLNIQPMVDRGGNRRIIWTVLQWQFILWQFILLAFYGY